MSERKLPTNWTTSQINDLCDFSKEKGVEGIAPYLEIGNIDTVQKNYIITEKLSVKGCRVAKQNDVLISKVRPTRGAITLVREKKIQVSSAFAVLRNNGSLADKYLFFFLAWNRAYFKYLGENCTGTMYPTTSDEVVGTYKVPVAPLEEQRSIVLKLEELLSELDKGIGELQAAQKKLKIYRASILAAAYLGKLVPTEDELARSNGYKYETGEELLARLIKKKPEKLNGRKNKQSDTSDITPSLPTGWTWSSLGQIFEVFVGSTPSRANSDYWNGDIGWISSGEVAFRPITETREKITITGLENSSTKIHPVGTVMLAMIGEGKTRGQVALLKIPAAHNQNTAAIRVSSTEIKPNYVYRFLESQYEITRRAGSGNNQPALNKTLVEKIKIPLPPLAEQERIVVEIERRLSIVDQAEDIISKNLQRVEGLRQSILRKGFDGDLVPRHITKQIHSPKKTMPNLQNHLKTEIK